MKHSIKKRIERLLKDTDTGEVICFISPNSENNWAVKWNNGKKQNQKDGFHSIDQAIAFAESFEKVSHIFYFSREVEDGEE